MFFFAGRKSSAWPAMAYAAMMVIATAPLPDQVRVIQFQPTQATDEISVATIEASPSSATSSVGVTLCFRANLIAWPSKTLFAIEVDNHVIEFYINNYKRGGLALDYSTIADIDWEKFVSLSPSSWNMFCITFNATDDNLLVTLNAEQVYSDQRPELHVNYSSGLLLNFINEPSVPATNISDVNLWDHYQNLFTLSVKLVKLFSRVSARQIGPFCNRVNSTICHLQNHSTPEQKLSVWFRTKKFYDIDPFPRSKPLTQAEIKSLYENCTMDFIGQNVPDLINWVDASITLYNNRTSLSSENLSTICKMTTGQRMSEAFLFPFAMSFTDAFKFCDNLNADFPQIWSLADFDQLFDQAKADVGCPADDVNCRHVWVPANKSKGKSPQWNQVTKQTNGTITTNNILAGNVSKNCIIYDISTKEYSAEDCKTFRFVIMLIDKHSGWPIFQMLLINGENRRPAV